MAKSSGLGRGLGALLGESAKTMQQPEETGVDAVVELKVSQIEPGKAQPRSHFDAEKIAELAQSIREYGIVQPIVVRKKDNGYYEIIAGERRWRAARSIGLKTVPAIVREYGDERVLEIALIENLQREDLNPIEEAQSYARLMDELSYTQEQLSQKLGKSRPQVANTVRLLSLCPAVQKRLAAGELSSGHARALLSLGSAQLQEKAAEAIVEKGMSVREAELLVKTIAQKQDAKKRSAQTSGKTPSTAQTYMLQQMQEALSARFGTKVRMVPGKQKSKIEIEYYSDEDLQRILHLLGN